MMLQRLQRVRDNLDRARRDTLLLVTADLRSTAALLCAGVLRPRPGGCALFGYGRDPAAPGYQAAAPAYGLAALR